MKIGVRNIAMIPAPMVMAQDAFISCDDAEEDEPICESDSEIFVQGNYTVASETEFRLRGSLHIFEGATLFIEPGANIVFAAPEDGSDRSEQTATVTLNGGNIRAVGSEEQPIVIKREEKGPRFSMVLSRGRAIFEQVRIKGGGMPAAEVIFPAFLPGLYPTTVHADDYYWSVFPAMQVRDAVVTVRDSSFSQSEGADILMVDNLRRGHLDENGILRWDDASLSVFDTDFEGDTAVPAFLSGYEQCPPDQSCRCVVTFRNNWYGSDSGPRTAGHYGDRSGKEVIGAVNIEGFSSDAFFSDCDDCASNVLFLPGLKASQLYLREEDGGEDRLWVPNDFSGNDMADLHFDAEGQSEHEVYTEDVLEEVPFLGTNIYKSFFADLERMRTEGVINDYSPFAYDWRQSAWDIVENGTPYPDGRHSPVEELIRMSETSKSGKVTIIAHSNGGLLAKALMIRLKELGREDLVDRVVLVASPQMGTPTAALSLLYGYEESLPLLLKQWEAREFAETIPGAFGLLPSMEYFDRSSEDIISFASGNRSGRLSRYRAVYDAAIETWEEFVSFLSGEGDGREEPDAEEIDEENVLDKDLLHEAEDLHRKIDSWVPPRDVEVIEIAGWGLDTVSGIRYVEKEKGYCLPSAGKVPFCHATGEYETFYEPKFTVDGDAVVTASSAHMIPDSTDGNVKRYWVDLYSYGKDNLFGRKHINIFEVNSIRDFILKENLGILPKYFSQNHLLDYKDMKPRIRMSLYSPLDVHITDGSENHTGPREVETEDGLITILEENVPGSSYFQFGERKYVSFPVGEPIEVRLDGYADGAYTLTFEEIRVGEGGEESVSHTAFEYLPTTPDTVVALSVPEEGLSGISPLSADIDGDGETDYAIEPIMGGVATLEAPETDIDPPVTMLGLSGSEAANGWFVGDVTVTLSADDGMEGSGVARTEYSFDGGEGWETYTEPFIVSGGGVTAVSFRSVDGVGNMEETGWTEIKIDRVAPVARIGFDPDSRNVVVSGFDDYSDVTPEREERDITPRPKGWRGLFARISGQTRNENVRIRVGVTLADEAGHVTEVAYTEERRLGTTYELSDFSVSRDGNIFDVSDTHATYVAVPGRWWRDHAMLSSILRVKSEAVSSWYDRWRNVTFVTSVTERGELRREQKSGVMIPMFEVTDNGIEVVVVK